jgi:hypothetical protein
VCRAEQGRFCMPHGRVALPELLGHCTNPRRQQTPPREQLDSPATHRVWHGWRGTQCPSFRCACVPEARLL